MYSTLEEAKDEIWKRWKNESLKKQVGDYLKEVPIAFKHEPRAVLSRHIATPNVEFIYFMGLSKKVNLNPLVFEYLNDKFVSKNPDKYYLCKL